MREGNLIDLAADGTMPQARIKQKLREINDQRERLTERLASTNDELSYGVRLVEACLKLLERPHELYRQCSEAQRRLLNQALFTRIYVHRERGVEAELREPFAQLDNIHRSYRQGRDDAPPPPATSSGASAPRIRKKAVSDSGDGLLRSQLDGFIKGMDDHAQGSNKPPRVGLNASCYNPYVSMKALVSDLELLIVKLPAPGDRVRPERDPLPQTIRDLRASQLAGIIADYQAGATVSDIATRYGFNCSTVSTTLKRAGIRLRGSGLTPDQIDQAVSLYDQGQSLARIGDRFGVDAHTVRRRLLERGVAMRDTHGRRR